MKMRCAVQPAQVTAGLEPAEPHSAFSCGNGSDRLVQRDRGVPTVFEVVRRQVRYYGGSFGEFLESYHAWGPRRPFFRGGRKTSTLCWLREDRACSSRWCGAPLTLL